MKAISKYSHRHFESLVKLLRQYEKRPGPETLHDVRVEIKKLKTLFHLANASLKKFRMQKKFQPLRSVFKKAGAIRVADVNRGLEKTEVKEHTDPDVNPQRIAFRKATPGRIATVRRLDRKLRGPFRKIGKKDLLHYLKKTKSDVKVLLSPRFDREDLHPSRKKIKDILYLSQIADQKKPEPFYDKIQDVIGKWHDKQTLLATLRLPEDREEINKLKAESRDNISTIKKLISGFYGRRDPKKK